MTRTSILLIAVGGQLTLGACRKQAEPEPSAKPSEPKPAAATRPSGPTGTIKGIVHLTGTPPEMPLLQRGSDPVCGATAMHAETVLAEGGLLANALVRVKPHTVPGWVPSEPVRIDQIECMFRPRVQAAVAGQTLEMTNSDATAHNINARRVEWGHRQDLETVFNRAQPSGAPTIATELGTDVDILRLKCDMHGWMQAYVIVSDNPYAAVSGKDGSFVLTDVPVGPLELQAWHEFFGVKSQTVTVTAGQTVTIDVTYDAAADRPVQAGAAPAPAPTAPAPTAPAPAPTAP